MNIYGKLYDEKQTLGRWLRFFIGSVYIQDLLEIDKF